MTTPRVPIPAHLAKYDWYAPHCAWLIAQSYDCRHDPAGARPKRANLRGADLSSAYLRGAYLRGAYLSGADLRYADLSYADLRSANLRGAYLRGAYLRGADLRYADLSYADLRSADLRSADLRSANLRYADLSSADLRSANLRSADLSSADLSYANLSYADVPVVPDLDAKILAAINGGGSLNMGDWHTCETTHCRGGWAVNLAGEAGAKLEKKVGVSVAAALIYHASTGRVPDFYASNEDAMADIRACAARAEGGGA